MKEILYDKLIRDRIPEIIESHGKRCEVSVLSDEKFEEYLKKKLQEEVDEFLDDGNIEELADILEVIYATLRVKGSSPEELEQIRKKKCVERGSFDQKLLLTKVLDSR